jgi:hypothetical protein
VTSLPVKHAQWSDPLDPPQINNLSVPMKSHDFSPSFSLRISRTCCPYFFFPYSPHPPYFIPVLFPLVLFSRTYSKVATFEIQHFKISVSCFSSTCRYNTVHVPCGISIRTSTVGLPLEGWGACMRDLKGPTMNLFNPKED